MLPRRNQAENQGKMEFFRDLVLNLTQIRAEKTGAEAAEEAQSKERCRESRHDPASSCRHYESRVLKSS